MNGYFKIPDEVKCIALSGNETQDSVIDTKGLGCIIKPVGGELYIKAKRSEADTDAFVLSDGESFEFCGSVTVFSKTTVSVNCMFYSTL